MWQVSIIATVSREEAVAGWLQKNFRLPPALYHDLRTGKSTVSIYPPRLSRGPELVRAALRRELRQRWPERMRVVVKKLRRENWAESWKRHFKPMEIGDALLIKPGWSRHRARASQRVVWLDPGLSFGTGHHATTRFCLEQLADCRREGMAQSLLDIGTGSGILAIAAAKLDYSPIEAFDFDPVAVRVSRSNARRNRVEGRVAPRQQDLRRLPLRGRRWDVICANLTADLLQSQARRICARLRPGGALIVAGVLRKEFSRVRDNFLTFGLTLAKSEVNEEWKSGRFESPESWAGC